MTGRSYKHPRQSKHLCRFPFPIHHHMASGSHGRSSLDGLQPDGDPGDGHFTEWPLQQSTAPLRSHCRNFTQVVDRQLTTLWRKDAYTACHSMQVEAFALSIGKRLGLSSGDLNVIGTASVLHDIGKIGIADSILKKPGPLTSDEFGIMKRHPAIGAAMLEPHQLGESLCPLVLHHHEWYDGSGYPNGLRGDEIPFGATIIQAADCIDAMLSPRSYKSSFDVKKVVRELREGCGVQFHPIVAAEAIQWLEDFPMKEELPSHEIIQHSDAIPPTSA